MTLKRTFSSWISTTKPYSWQESIFDVDISMFISNVVILKCNIPFLRILFIWNYKHYWVCTFHRASFQLQHDREQWIIACSITTVHLSETHWLTWSTRMIVISEGVLVNQMSHVQFQVDKFLMMFYFRTFRSKTQ